MDDTLHIVGCTKTKVWYKGKKISDYVPAKHAYQGKGFLKALLWVAGKQWVILSGKYGFIEPDHPIGRYDVNLGYRRDRPISDKTLKDQVRQKRIWRVSNKLVEVRLVDFRRVVCINCNKTYLEKVKMAFPKNKIYMGGLT